MVLLFLVLSCYTFILESASGGQTVGKALLKIRVIKRDGSQPKIQDYFLRWSMRIIDYGITICSVGWGLMASSKYRQRLGDVYADTIIIYDRTRHVNRFGALVELQEKSQEVEITIPNLEKLREDDILLAKQLINNQTIYSGEVLLSKIDNLVQHFVFILDLEMPDNQKSFLTNIIKQYVFKTRS